MGVVSSIIAGTIGTAVLLGAGGTAVGMGVHAAGKEKSKQKQLKEKQLAAQQAATAEMLAAPAKAAEKARLESMEKRRRRSKTLLTSKKGVLEENTPARKTLLGA